MPVTVRVVSHKPEEGASRSAARPPSEQEIHTEAPCSVEDTAMASPAHNFDVFTTSVLISIRRTARPECALGFTVNILAEMEDILSAQPLLRCIANQQVCNTIGKDRHMDRYLRLRSPPVVARSEDPSQTDGGRLVEFTDLEVCPRGVTGCRLATTLISTPDRQFNTSPHRLKPVTAPLFDCCWRRLARSGAL